MLRFAPLALLLLAACSDMAPRDRSLLLRTETFPLHKEVFRNKRPLRPAAQPSVIGLATDPLAVLYAENAPLVIRCAAVTTLEEDWKPHGTVLRKILPGLGLPEHPPATLLRIGFALPDTVLVDREKPFAFVATRAGWAALIPVTGEFETTDRLRMLDAHYCVAGSPEAVAAYEPGFRSGFHLPGDVSVLARGPGAGRFGLALQEAAAVAGIALPALPAPGGRAASDVKRVDAALRFSDTNARLDVRFAPDRGVRGGLADLLTGLRPRAGTALQWLPEGATLECATGTDLTMSLSLARMLGLVEDEWPLVREAVAPLGDDIGLQIHLRGDRPSVALMVAELAAPDRKAAGAYLGSESMLRLLKQLSARGGHLEYAPEAFERNGVKVGTVTGYFGERALEDLRNRAGLPGTLAEFLRGPIVVYVALTDRQLCVVAGERSRDDMEALLDRIAGGTPRRADRVAPGETLLHERLFALRIELGALLRGAKEFGRHWHPRGNLLRELAFEEELPIDFVASVEGGALRLATQVPDAELATVIARIGDALAEER